MVLDCRRSGGLKLLATPVRSSPQALSRQLSDTLLGVKGSMLRQKNSPSPEVKEENPAHV